MVRAIFCEVNVSNYEQIGEKMAAWKEDELIVPLFSILRGVFCSTELLVYFLRPQ